MRIHNHQQQELFEKTDMNLVFDLDGTLSNDDWRVHLCERDEEGKTNWDAYHSQGKYDLPIPNMFSIYNAFAESGFGLILLTGRPIKYKGDTQGWLQQYKLPYHSLFMRPENDYSPNDKLKLRLLKENGFKPDNVVCVFDNNERVIMLLREYGYVTFHVVMP